MEIQQAYRAEVKRIMDVGNEHMCPIPRANAEMLAATKFWPDHCPHCGEKNTAHHAECPTREM
jgi:hypothetical protein